MAISPEEVRKKTADQFQPTTNSILFVVRDTNPDDNLNFQKLGDVSQDVPTNEAARRFFSEFKKQFPEMIKQQDPGAQVTAMQIIDLAGGVAFTAEFFSMRGDTRMKQRSVMLIVGGFGFTITCTARSNNFIKTDQNGFATMLESLIFD